MVFKKDFILLDTMFSNKLEAFSAIAEKAVQAGIIKETKPLIEGFISREKEGTTGFEDGFAIPHARIDEVIEPAIFVLRNKSFFSDWDSLDEQGVKYVIALLVPLSQTSQHIEILSSVAMKMMDPGFREMIKQGNVQKIFEIFSDFIKNVPQNNNEISSRTEHGKLMVGISACPAGVAHTFMVKQKMEDSAKELGYDIKWETQGSQGQRTPLTKEEIDRADVIIIASDIELDLSRFENKKIYITDTNDAIKNGTALVNRALAKSTVYNNQKHDHSQGGLKLFKQAFMSSFGFPWTFLGITVTILSTLSLIGFSMYGRQWAESGVSLNLNLFKAQEIAKFALYLAMPLMSMYVVYNMRKSYSLSFIVLIGALLLNLPVLANTSNTITSGGAAMVDIKYVNVFYDWNVFDLKTLHGTNIIGSLVFVSFVLLLHNFVKKSNIWLSKNRVLKGLTSPWMNNLILAGIPLLFCVFLLGAPLSYVSTHATGIFIDYANNYWWLRFLVGGALGALVASDLGGPVNKFSLIALIGLAQYDLRFATLISIAIPMASIGYGTTYYFRKKSFKPEDSEEASKSFRKGLKGMTEGPFNATHKYKWRISAPNIISTFIGCGLAHILGFYMISGGHIGVLYAGAQAHLATPNDIGFLNQLFPLSNQQGAWWLFIPSLLYGIICYYFVMLIGSFTYLGIASFTFALPGKKSVFVKKG